MIITLKGADFSTNNIGTLSTWAISRVLGNGATYSGSSYVEKGVALNATITIANDYEISSAGVTVTMGGAAVTSGITVNGNTITISIASVTGNVVIKVPTVNINTGETSDLDSATSTFIAAASITESAMISKLDTLVKSLKSNNLWDKIDALYPCVGTTFNQMSYNLKDPTTYQLSCSGTPTIVANDSMYHATAQIKSDYPTTIPDSDFHVLGASGTKRSELANGATFFSIGPTCEGGLYGGVLTLVSASSVTLRTTSQDTWKATTAIDGDGLLIASLTSGIVYNGADLGATKTGTPSITSWTGGVDKHLNHNCFNSSTKDYEAGHTNSPYKVRMSGFGKALTTEEMIKYSQILNAFKSMY